MGRPMAVNLARKHRVIGFDVSADRFTGLEGVTRAADTAQIAAQCRVICLSLPSAAVVEEVVLGSAGLAGRVAAGTLVIDFSTSLPGLSRRIAKTLEGRGAYFADAPVSGGEGGAKSASLAIMVGASPETYEKAKPYLGCLGTSVRVGEVGAGGVAKLVNNMIVGAAFAVIAEGFALAERNGLDATDLYEAIKSGWAGSKVLDVSGPAIAKREYVPGGTVNMLQKDLSYARTLAAESHVPIPMTAAAHELFVAGQAAGRGAQSQPALFELWRREGSG